MPFPKKWETSLPLIRMEYDINIPYGVFAYCARHPSSRRSKWKGMRGRERIRNVCVYKEREREKVRSVGEGG